MRLKRLTAGAAAAVLIFTLAGCSAPADGSAGTDAAGMDAAGAEAVGPAVASPEARLDETGGDAFAQPGDAPYPSMVAEEQSAADRSIVRTASMQLTVPSARDAAAGVAVIAGDLGGSVTSQSVSSAGASAHTADVSIRVPTERLEAAMTKLAELGDVVSEQRSADDVTEAHVDLQARVAALTASVERLTELLNGAATTSELIEAETALSARQQELDGLRAQLESLESSVEQATIWVSLSEPSALPGGGPQTFWEALQAGVASIGGFFAAAFIAFGVALPWIALAAIVVLAIALPLRARKRRARRAASPENALSTKPAESVAEAEQP
ncbi:DUF4349 domain-containing protein [Leucobacter albus]|uniref:DUF4349 domain-containing protein n=1 Tax=Leucobacter albus TaxID=272210 RepID=A0ABW3TTM1_9MICO